MATCQAIPCHGRCSTGHRTARTALITPVAPPPVAAPIATPVATAAAITSPATIATVWTLSTRLTHYTLATILNNRTAPRLIVRKFLVLFKKIGHVQKRVPFEAQINKSRLHPGKHARYAALVDTAG